MPPFSIRLVILSIIIRGWRARSQFCGVVIEHHFTSRCFRELTRPAARSERAELLSKLNALGIATVLDVQAVYQTPPFEAELLAQSDLPALPAWRAADVVRVVSALQQIVLSPSLPSLPRLARISHTTDRSGNG